MAAVVYTASSVKKNTDAERDFERVLKNRELQEQIQIIDWSLGVYSSHDCVYIYIYTFVVELSIFDS